MKEKFFLAYPRVCAAPLGGGEGTRVVGVAGGTQAQAPAPPPQVLALCASASQPPGRSRIPILYNVNTRPDTISVMESRDFPSFRHKVLIINGSLFPAFMSF